MKKSYIALFAGLLAYSTSYAQNTAWPSSTSSDNVGIGTLYPASKLNVSPNGEGGILIGNPNTGAGGFTSLFIHISANQNGYSYLQSVKSAGSSYGLLAFNPWGGKVGFGTNNPASQFQVDDGCTKASIGSAAGPNLNYGTSYLGFNAARNVDNQNNWISQGDGANNGGGVIYTSIFGDIYFSAIESTGPNDKQLSDAQIKDRIKFRISPDGTTYAKAIKVETTNWPDYVFKSTYKLPSLTSVKTYIDKNQHLPEMPSEAEVAKDGVNLGEMNKLLLKKVEELTLYLIEQRNQLENQQQRLTSLEKITRKASEHQK